MSGQSPLIEKRAMKGDGWTRAGILDRLNAELNERSEYTERFTFDFAVDGGVIGAHVIGALPASAKIIKSYYAVVTTFTSAGDTATLALGTGAAPAGFVAAVAINDAGNPWDAGLAIASLVNDVASGIEGNSQNVVLTTAVQALTAGKLHVWVKYVIAE